MTDLKGKSVLVLGLGRFGGGSGAIRFLVSQGAQVRVSDVEDKNELKDAIQALAGVPVDFRLGGHDVSHLDDIDLVVVNPAIPPHHPFLKIVEEKDIAQTTEVNLFFERCQGEIIGITGTNGKETVVRMIQEMLRAHEKHSRTYVGGNVGQSLLAELPNISANDRVIFELSSFQLHRLRWIKRRPNIAVITNIQPDHLDWHESFDNYLNDKLVILEGQGPHSVAIINVDDSFLSKVVNKVEGTLVKVSLRPLDSGVFIDKDSIVAKDSNGRKGVWRLSSTNLSVPGRHNLSNAALAAAVGHIEDIPVEKIESAIIGFKGVSHALEYVGERKGIKFYNDSAATNPEATIAALHSFENPIWLIAGGYDKKIDYSPVIEEISQRVKGLATVGQLTDALAQGVADLNVAIPINPSQTLQRAFDWTVQRAQPGEVIILSPATSSYDQFLNLEQRGEMFRLLVERLPHGA